MFTKVVADIASKQTVHAIETHFMALSQFLTSGFGGR